MSYCVNCGVELDESAKKCALCSTEVINPNKKQQQDAAAPFSSEVHIPESVKARFVAGILTVVMLIPNVVCFVTNLIFSSTGFWSLYIMSTSFLLWLLFVFPFFTKKRKPYLMWAADTLGVIFYVYFFFVMDNDSKNWYINAALPIILTVSALVLIYMLWAKKRHRHTLLKLVHIFSDIAVVSIVSGVLLMLATGMKILMGMGIIGFVSSVAIIIFFAYCYSSRSMRKYLSKKLFVN